MDKAMQTYVILLRGVMPTGKNRVPMAQLREALTAAGLKNVQTYIQSGNVVADSALDQAELETLVGRVIAERIGAQIRVIARSATDFRWIVEESPFASEDTGKLYFSLLAEAPAPERLQQLLARDFSPDEVRGGNLALYTCYATKYSDSKVNNNLFERQLKVAVTTRNFNTMTRLVALSGKSSN
jgi:uncharacterized protein (DUF1697 family)